MLGRVSPATYDRWLAGHLQPAPTNDLEEMIGRLEGAPAEVPVQTMLERLMRAQSDRRDDRDRRLDTLRGRATAIVVAMLLIMIMETFVRSEAAWTRHLGTARYALIALWIALLLAQPALAAGVSGVFVVLLAMVCIAAAVAPMRRVGFRA
ncbi:MAG: hypothetical protein CMJ18_24775 [Phycisphaeraceae bacterium]|nr:hypothetical protein [Phycisphaeraceae bacterium]